MKYRAKLDGFIGGRRIRAGQVFEFEGSKKPGKWMEPVKEAPAGKPGKAAKPAEPEAPADTPSNQNVI